MLRHLSLFSGIGGIDLGFERAGMVAVGQVENDPHCVSVLERWWPDVPRWEDVRGFQPGRHFADVVSGGFPCQDVSVAGKRAGLAGSRSGLWWEFHRILAEIRPTWVVVENVPGLLSSNDGRDFAAILGGLGELGYGLVWRVLDAQWFGVAQRRRRVFIVGHSGNRSPFQVLDLAQGCCGDLAPSRQAGPAVAALTSCGLGGGGPDDNPAQAGHVIAWDSLNDQANTEIAPTLGQNTDMATGRAGTILAPVAFAENQQGQVRFTDKANLTGGGGKPGQGYPAALTTSGVRRLTPVECARLQGFPDNWNAEDANGKPIADTHRYRQYGNAVCVPVAEWIGRRIVLACPPEGLL